MTTKRNTISRVCINLHIINVMDAFAALAANCAGMIIAFSNHVFESFVERWRIWFERYSAFPRMRLISVQMFGLPFGPTIMRTKFSPVRKGWFNIKDYRADLAYFFDFGRDRPTNTLSTTEFPTSFYYRYSRIKGTVTSWAYKFYAFFACLIVAFCRAIFATVNSAFFDIEVRSAMGAYLFRITACPRWGLVTNQINGSPFSITSSGTKTRYIRATRIHLKSFATLFTDFLDLRFAIWVRHITSLKGAPRRQPVLCSDNTGPWGA